jgi:hypothetical protein
MPRFVASQAVDALDYDFSMFDAGIGTVPEPTAPQLRAFEQWMRNPFGGTEQSDIPKKYAEMSDEEALEVDKDSVEHLAALCSGIPSADDLFKVNQGSPRIYREFFFWLWGELTNPTKPTAGTNKSLVAATNGASSS